MKFDARKALIIHSGALAAVVVARTISATSQGSGPAATDVLDTEE